MTDSNPFAAGPYAWVPNALGVAPNRPWLRVAVTALVSWAPLLILAVVQDVATGEELHRSLLNDWGAYARYLVAAPLFVAAASVYVPEIGIVVGGFALRGFVADADRPRFETLVESTRRQLSSRWTEAAILILAYGITATLSARLLYPSTGATWQGTLTPSGRPSLPGWWRLVVSQPLFLGLSGVWLWRVAAWGRFLFVVSRMKLETVAAHPDLLGGLRFVRIPLRGFLILAFAIGVVLAGSGAQTVLLTGALPANLRLLIGAQVILTFVLFAGPLLPLAPMLLHLQVRGTIEYGMLATRVGQAFQERWIRARETPPPIDALGAPDFSATTDLYSIVANIRQINIFVLDPRTVIALLLAALLPWLPVVSLLVPFEQIIQLAAKALL